MWSAGSTGASLGRSWYPYSAFPTHGLNPDVPRATRQMPKTMISAIWYHYKPNDPAYAGSNAPNDWLDRIRLFFLMNF